MMTFEQMFRAYARDVRRFALWISGDAAQADDLTSETFVRAWMGPAKVRTGHFFIFDGRRNLRGSEEMGFVHSP
ncbi:MAG: hypothetical protein FJY80_07550 [Candidatus Aminicenantes bacterium]|nr:hypothetical protein [Candidatus Aminicenantes bacterium]